jgi:uncharacterized membrane protein
MQGKATIAGHPVHPPLVTFPIGCFIAAAIAELISIWGGTAFWGPMSMWLIAFGTIGALLAAPFGLIDYMSAPMSADARRIANWHMTLNTGTIVVFGVAFGIRYFDPSSAWYYVMTAAGIVLLAVAGTLGGSLAHRHLIGSSEEDIALDREAADMTQMGPSERIARERERVRSTSRGRI